MSITVFRNVTGLFSSRNGESGKGRVCPDGHVMHPSWDVCPYCEQMKQDMAGSRSSGGGTPPMPIPAVGVCANEPEGRATGAKTW